MAKVAKKSNLKNNRNRVVEVTKLDTNDYVFSAFENEDDLYEKMDIKKYAKTGTFGVTYQGNPIFVAGDDGEVRLDVNTLPAGIYFLSISDKSFKFVKK